MTQPIELRVRVLLLSPYASRSSGVASLVRALVARLPDLGHPTRFEEVRVGDVPVGMKNAMLAWRAVRAVWRLRNEFDVVHCQQLHAQSLFACLAARALGKGAVLTVHGRSPRPTGLRGVAFDLVERLCLDAPHRLVCVAESLRIALGRGEVVPGGVHVADVRAHAGRVASTGEDAGLRLLFIGRVTVDKGIFVLIDALRRAREATGAAIRLVVVGPVAKEVGLELSARLGGLEGAIEFAGEHEDPWRFLRDADVFILPSFHEGLPLALLEAMAVGLPAIATRVGDVPDVVRTGETGWLVPPRDVAALARAIEDAITSRRTLPELGSRAANLVASRYDLEGVVAEYVRLYAESTPDHSRGSQSDSHGSTHPRD